MNNMHLEFFAFYFNSTKLFFQVIQSMEVIVTSTNLHIGARFQFELSHTNRGESEEDIVLALVLNHRLIHTMLVCSIDPGQQR